MLECRKLIAKYGKFVALKNIDAVFYPGKISILFGPNGAGKTTLLKLLATVMKPNAGSILYYGEDIVHMPQKYRSKLGFLSHDLMLYNNLTGAENISFWYSFYSNKKDNSEIDELLRTVGLENVKNKLVKSYSRGMKQRLSIARSMINKPQIIIWDEPFSGIDAFTAKIIGELLLNKKNEDAIIIITMHDLSAGYQLADMIYLLSNGRLSFFSSKADVSYEKFKEIFSSLNNNAPIC
jgi:ABC-type multidrug transport system ATPase subunit